MIKPELTIIIPAKNEENYIGNLLSSLFRQDYEAMPETEIYVADAHSTDKTREVVKSFEPQLKVFLVEGGIPSVGRNRAAASAKTRYILFLDADIILDDPATIRLSLEFAKTNGLHLAAIDIHCPEGYFSDKFIYFLNNLSQRLSRYSKPYAIGMFMFFEKKIFDALGGFDEKVAYAEDAFLSGRVDRRHFGVVPSHITATNRRFIKMGRGKVLGLALKTALNRGNKSFFYKDHGYFNY